MSLNQSLHESRGDSPFFSGLSESDPPSNSVEWATRVIRLRARWVEAPASARPSEPAATSPLIDTGRRPEG
jgi:hypothetical protein